mmetsp:Transcript_87385/g.232855  ORF Transcript_87385/g.232855 Transcript_87385/m.232855 type:complete len:232 (-) Transcript_87385:136-831(-)
MRRTPRSWALPPSTRRAQYGTSRRGKPRPSSSRTTRRFTTSPSRRGRTCSRLWAPTAPCASSTSGAWSTRPSSTRAARPRTAWPCSGWRGTSRTPTISRPSARTARALSCSTSGCRRCRRRTLTATRRASTPSPGRRTRTATSARRVTTIRPSSGTCKRCRGPSRTPSWPTRPTTPSTSCSGPRGSPTGSPSPSTARCRSCACEAADAVAAAEEERRASAADLWFEVGRSG